MDNKRLATRANARMILCGWMALSMVLVLLTAGIASAHFALERNVRIVHVEHTRDGLRVFIRLPTPYVLASPEAEKGGEGADKRSRFIQDEELDGLTVHRLDTEALADGLNGFAALVADGHVLSIDNKRILPDSVEVRIHENNVAPEFSTLAQARETFAQPVDLDTLGSVYVGDTLTDAALVFLLDDDARTYSFGSSLDPGLEGQDRTDNLLNDHLPGTSRLYRATGTLGEPIQVSRSPFASLSSFVREGVIHIIEGLDHVLFVICLALGAATIQGLLWRVTGFTLGHSVTLSLGFFGFVPSGAWFVPSVETAIALSIVYAAAVALFFPTQTGMSERRWFVITALIGLLHGLGFSFVLHAILQVDSPDVWQSLLAFNVGVEIGQVAIVLAIWPLSMLLAAYVPGVWRYIRGGVLVGCILISAFWAVERIMSVLQTI